MEVCITCNAVHLAHLWLGSPLCLICDKDKDICTYYVHLWTNTYSHMCTCVCRCAHTHSSQPSLHPPTHTPTHTPVQWLFIPPIPVPQVRPPREHQQQADTRYLQCLHKQQYSTAHETNQPYFIRSNKDYNQPLHCDRKVYSAFHLRAQPVPQVAGLMSDTRAESSN